MSQRGRPLSHYKKDVQESCKDSFTVKDALLEFTCLDVLVCGTCQQVFHLIFEFHEHKKICTFAKPQDHGAPRNRETWAYTLWKNSKKTKNLFPNNADNTLMWRHWKNLDSTKKEIWITAGNVFFEIGVVEKIASDSKVIAEKFDNALNKNEKPVVKPVPLVNLLNDPKLNAGPTVRVERVLIPNVMGTSVPKEKEVVVPTKKEKEVVVPTKKEKEVAVPTKKEKEVLVPTKAPNTKTPSKRISSLETPVPTKKSKVTVTPESEKESSEESSQEYVVEAIVGKRFDKSTMSFQYEIKWEGFPSSQNTWEPEANLTHCKSLIVEFETKRAGMSASGKPMRSSKANAIDKVKLWVGSKSAVAETWSPEAFSTNVEIKIEQPDSLDMDTNDEYSGVDAAENASSEEEYIPSITKSTPVKKLAKVPFILKTSQSVKSSPITLLQTPQSVKSYPPVLNTPQSVKTSPPILKTPTQSVQTSPPILKNPATVKISTPVFKTPQSVKSPTIVLKSPKSVKNSSSVLKTSQSVKNSKSNTSKKISIFTEKSPVARPKIDPTTSTLLVANSLGMVRVNAKALVNVKPGIYQTDTNLQLQRIKPLIPKTASLPKRGMVVITSDSNVEKPGIRRKPLMPMGHQNNLPQLRPQNNTINSKMEQSTTVVIPPNPGNSPYIVVTDPSSGIGGLLITPESDKGQKNVQCTKQAPSISNDTASSKKTYKKKRNTPKVTTSSDIVKHAFLKAMQESEGKNSTSEENDNTKSVSVVDSNNTSGTAAASSTSLSMEVSQPNVNKEILSSSNTLVITEKTDDIVIEIDKEDDAEIVLNQQEHNYSVENSANPENVKNEGEVNVESTNTNKKALTSNDKTNTSDSSSLTNKEPDHGSISLSFDSSETEDKIHNTILERAITDASLDEIHKVLEAEFPEGESIEETREESIDEGSKADAVSDNKSSENMSYTSSNKELTEKQNKELTTKEQNKKLTDEQKKDESSSSPSKPSSTSNNATLSLDSGDFMLTGPQMVSIPPGVDPKLIQVPPNTELMVTDNGDYYLVPVQPEDKNVAIQQDSDGNIQMVTVDKTVATAEAEAETNNTENLILVTADGQQYVVITNDSSLIK